MVNGVHAGNDGGQSLRGADVGGGFFAANVLLAGLQCQTVSGVAVGINAYAYQAAWHGTFELVNASQISGVRATSAHGHTKALGCAYGNVCTHFARRFEQCQREQVGSQNQGCAFAVDNFSSGAPVGQPAVGGGVLADGGKVIIACNGGIPFGLGLDQAHFNAQRLCAGLDDFNGLRVAVGMHDKYIAFGFNAAFGQRHGFGGGSGFTQHGSVGNCHACQVGDQSLEVKQSFQTALADFSLIGRVGGIPSGVFKQIAQNHAGQVGAVKALPDVAFK